MMESAYISGRGIAGDFLTIFRSTDSDRLCGFDVYLTNCTIRFDLSEGDARVLVDKMAEVVRWHEQNAATKHQPAPIEVTAADLGLLTAREDA